MCRIFLSVLLVPTLLCFPFLHSMELWSLDNKSPLREKYLNEQKQHEKETSRLLSDQSKGFYTNSFQAKKEDSLEENLSSRVKKRKDNVYYIFELPLGSWFRSFYSLSSSQVEKKEDYVSHPIFGLPIEIRDHIINFYSNGLVDNKKEVIPGLLYLMTVKKFLSKNYKKYELNKKIGLCHALHIIDKMEKVTTEEERQKLLTAASLGTRGKIFWEDMSDHSLWKGRLVNCNVEEQLQDYIITSQKYAALLKEICGKFPELLPKHLSVAKEGENKGKDYSDDESDYDQPKFDLLPIIKSYYDTRRQFINDSCHLEGKLRDRVNAVFRHLTKMRYCTPLYCCWMGSGLCATALTASPASALAVVTGLASFVYFALGCVFCGVCCNCSIDRIKDNDCIELCTCTEGNVDMCEFMTELDNNQEYNQVAQNTLKELAKGDKDN